MSEEFQTGAIADAAGPSSAVTPSTTQQEPQMVPLDALQAERALRQQRDEEIKVYQDNMRLWMAQQQASQQQQQPQQPSMSDDDVLTYGEYKKLSSQDKQEIQADVKELRMGFKHPDYHETVSKYLPEVLKENPGLGEKLYKTKDYELAYYLARNTEGYRRAHQSQSVNADAQRIVENSNRAGSLSSVGQVSPANEARDYKSMSDAEFMKIAAKNLGCY